ncbi:type VII secretion system-associated protein [Streptomyces griseus]|uniref:type VII secretion system-associated protein n=1 Tax=Streptomyces griseus TaxID=1911 RepID=UPI0036FCF42D
MGGQGVPSGVSGASGAPDAPGAPDVGGGTETVDASLVPDAVKDAARRAPGHWVGIVDPEWAGERTPPEWAVLGEWRSDEGGCVGEYRANPAYRPSARVLGWPEPTDPVDAAAQRAATGYGSAEAALEALADAEVTVVRGPDGAPLSAAGRDGALVMLLFTSPTHAFMSSALHHDSFPARELARSARAVDALLMVNPGAAAPLLVPADRLLGPVSGTGDPGPSEPGPHTTGRTTP